MASYLHDPPEKADLEDVEGPGSPQLLQILPEGLHDQQPDAVHGQDEDAAVEIIAEEVDVRDKVVQQATQSLLNILVQLLQLKQACARASRRQGL